MKYFLVIKADTDDGDYITSVNLVTQEQMKYYAVIVKATEACPQRHNCIVEDANGIERYNSFDDKTAQSLYGHLAHWNSFEAMLPRHEYLSYGIHTVVKMYLIEGTIIAM